MNQKNLFTRSALAAAIALISSNVSAAGFQLNEYSAAALGRAFSGEGAVADNASVGSRNPAAMTLFDRPSFSGGVIYIDPSVDITGTSPSGKSTDASNIAPSAWVPNLHFIMPLDEQWAIGASATSNYGLATEFNDDYVAGMLGGQTDLKTANLNLSAAYRLNDNFSFGLGLMQSMLMRKLCAISVKLAGVYCLLTLKPPGWKVPNGVTAGIRVFCMKSIKKTATASLIVLKSISILTVITVTNYLLFSVVWVEKRSLVP